MRKISLVLMLVVMLMGLMSANTFAQTTEVDTNKEVIKIQKVIDGKQDTINILEKEILYLEDGITNLTPKTPVYPSILFNVVPQNEITQYGGIVFIQTPTIGVQFGYRTGTAEINYDYGYNYQYSIDCTMSSLIFGINERLTKEVHLYQNLSLDFATARIDNYTAGASKCNFEFGVLLGGCMQVGFITDRSAVVVGIGIPLK